MNMWQRAAANKPLSAGERTFRKLLQSFGISGVVMSFPLVTQLEQSLIAGNVQIDWSQELKGIALAFSVAVGHAIAKSVTAHGDAPLGQVVDDGTNWLNQAANGKTGAAPTGGATMPVPGTQAQWMNAPVPPPVLPPSA